MFEDIVTSVTLQLALYFNTMFSALYFVVTLGEILQKLINLEFKSSLNRAMIVPVFVFWSGAEIPRFYFGYVGNLNERVPQMSAFLLTTLFPQLPSILYLSVVQEHKFPFDQIAGYMMLALLLLEMVVGYNALRALIRRKTAQFYRLCQDEEETRGLINS